MNFFEKIIHLLEKGEMVTPTNYSWFHLMFVAIVIAATVLLCSFFKDCDEKTFRRIVLIGWAIITALEIYKQFVFSFEFDGTTAKWDYQWYAFPYQLCSTPLYILPFVIFLKDGELRNSMMAYIQTFSLFGGLAVFFYPNDVFIETIGINFQTMVHHGLQVVFGIFFVVYNRKKLEHKYFLKAIPVFATLVSIAFTLNVLMYQIFEARGIDEDFNMFYIGPYVPSSLPILSDIYPKVPYVAFFLIYVVGFCAIATGLYYAEYGITRLSFKLSRYEKRRKEKTA